MRLRVTLAVLAVTAGVGALTMLAVPAASAATTALCNVNSGGVIGCVQSRGVGKKADLYPKGSPYLTNFTLVEKDGYWLFKNGSDCLTASSATFITLAPCGMEGDQWEPYIAGTGYDEWENVQGFVSGSCLEGDESATLGSGDPLSLSACSHEYDGQQWEWPVST